MSSETVIVNVQFKSSLSFESLQEISQKNINELTDVNGLIIKYYYFIPETKIVGGTYLFKNLKLARSYLRHFFLNGIGLKYGIIPDTLKMETGMIYLEIKGKHIKISK